MRSGTLLAEKGLLGTHLPGCVGVGQGGCAFAVSGKGGVKCRVSSDFCLRLFPQSVLALSTYVPVRRLVTWYGKLSVGSVVSVQIVLVIRVWSKMVCVWWCFKIQLFFW